MSGTSGTVAADVVDTSQEVHHDQGTCKRKSLIPLYSFSGGD